MKNRQGIINGLFGILLAIISGIAFILAFPPYEIWTLIFIGWVPVLVAQHRVMPAKLSSLPTAIAIGIWLEGYMGPNFNPTGSYMIYLPLVAALFAFLVVIGKRNFNQKTHYRYFVIEGGLSWSAIEMVRLFIPIAGTWGFIAYPLYWQVWFIQLASIFGIIGQGMLVMVVNLVLAQGIIYWLDQGAKFGIPSGIPEKMVRRGQMAQRWHWFCGPV